MPASERPAISAASAARQEPVSTASCSFPAVACNDKVDLKAHVWSSYERNRQFASSMARKAIRIRGRLPIIFDRRKFGQGQTKTDPRGERR